ncbi:ABC transporter ATP-binding protein [Clostridium sp. MSJ-4]|uniref:Spermidine/putrescine import ATP-binding protein PotA n=1 Tax=Clostridium simiarum TaxID=2841506 RepID=A0ABS6EW51_9CLOT|nr:ABC transporter ATP-binding protein [Clostridium simiarum]
MAEKAIVQLVSAFKSYEKDGEPVVKGISLDVEKGEFLTILGPSGCGKTTTLRMIAGFEQLTGGELYIDKEEVSSKAPYERNVNTVFQNYALFPHLNVFDNIAFGLTMKKVSKADIKQKVNEMIKIVRLEGYEKRMPSQLSGGQKQRVAIARAIINNPKVLLLDEPLGALDLKLRKQMQLELKHLQRELGITFIYVTHDQEEALTMSDRIAVMNEGNIEQIASPEEIYERPTTKFVADFIGETNLIEGKVSSIEKEDVLLEVEEGEKIRVENSDFSIGELVCIAVRPERLKIKEKPDRGDEWLRGTLKERIYIGAALRTVIELNNGREIVINEFAGEKFNFKNQKDQVFVTWKTDNAVVVRA